MPKISDEIEISAGGVVFYENIQKNIREYLLLKHQGAGHWDLPKGHIEDNESLQETALREVHEETGIGYENLIIIKKLNHVNKYTFRNKGRLIPKEVYLFLIQAQVNRIQLSDEHQDYIWLPFEHIALKLTYPTSLPAFYESEEYLKQVSSH